MGCFDTLNFRCPSCGVMTSKQSKADRCMCANYSLNDAPLSILADINDDGKEGRLYCECCNVRLELEVRFHAMPRVGGDIEDNEGWRTL